MLAASALTLVASAQIQQRLHPGDPSGPDDLVFVDLDTGLGVSCGVTKANNIRCWGGNRIGPVRAEGFTDVAVGRGHSCGIKLDGTVHCWGTSNTRGRLNIPVESDGSHLRLSSIDAFASGYYTCGIRRADGSAICWGWDFTGQSSGSSSEPDTFSYDYSGDTFSQLSPGTGHTCGVLSEGEDRGKIRCWGGYNQRGISVVPSTYADASFKSVHPGVLLTCAIIDGGAEDGKAICWGGSATGVLTETPTDVTFSQISVGQYHVCGVTTEKTVRCWGGTESLTSSSQEDFGQSDIPVEYRSATFRKVSAARYHTCGILDGQNGQTEGEVVCWGEKFIADPLLPSQIEGSRTTPPDYFYPPTSNLPEVDTGSYFNCALTIDSDMICWGGSVLNRPFTEGPFKAFAVGARHTCGVRDSGHVNCWGSNTNLQSSGWKPFLSANLQAASALVQNLTTDYTFKSVSAAYVHTCGVFDGKTSGQTEGEVLCWGHNANGQATSPADRTFARISVGLYHGCGLLDAQNGQIAGRAVCWGAENDLDENGNVVPTIYGFNTRADFGQAAIPSELADVTFKSISAGRYYTCAVRSDIGAVECWGYSQYTEIPEELTDERFSSVSVSSLLGFTCGITEGNRVKCWGPGEQHHVPEEYVHADFVSVSASLYHVCATNADGLVFCWGADADTSTPEIDIYKGSRIVNTRQAWVPRSFRALPPVVQPPPRPLASIRILRIEPAIRGVTMMLGERVRLSVEVYGRQDIRDSLGDRSDISFEWTAKDLTSQGRRSGELEEAVASWDERDPNGVPDDRRAVYLAPTQPGRYVVKSELEPGTECLGKREVETDEDVIERCTAIFEITVRKPSASVPTPVPPQNPAGDIPAVIVGDDGTNYEVSTPEDGGEFVTERCQLKVPEGAVNDMDVIGISVTELESPEQQTEVADLRFITDGIQCRIAAVDVEGAPISDYRLLSPSQICMPMPDAFRPRGFDALVGAINPDATLTALSSRHYLTGDSAAVKVCGNISSLSATTVVALRAEAAGELPPTPVPTLDVAEIDTGGLRLSERQGLIAMLLGVAILALAVGIVLGRRRARNH